MIAIDKNFIWILMAVFAYLINSVVFIIDKYFLTSTIPKPIVYTFYIGVLSLASLIFIPFGFTMVDSGIIIASAIYGLLYLLGLIFLFKGYKRIDISDAAPFAGAFLPIFVFLFSLFLIEETFSLIKLLAFVLLVAGGFIISFRKKHHTKLEKRHYYYLILSSILLGASFVIIKMIFDSIGFVNGYIWTRLGLFSFSILLLLLPSVREKIFDNFKSTKTSTRGLVIFNKVLVGIGFFILFFAISKSSVVLVNSLQGIQFAFLLMLVAIFSHKFKSLNDEKLFRQGIWNKIIAIILISIGLALLSIQ